MTTTPEPPQPRVEVHEDAAELSTAVAGELLNRIADAQAAGGVPSICLTGGTIAESIHREIARLAPESGVDWGAVEFWFGDERFVDPDSPDRNAGQARAAFLDEVGVPAHRIHQMPSPAEVPDVDTGAAAYAQELLASGGHFDVMMLGVGPDGHVASLFPGFPQLDSFDMLAVGVTGSPKPPPLRISLTFQALRNASSVWFLVSGEGKAEAVASALGGADLHQTPAAGVSGQDETIWFLDRDAASRL
ncbi:6-phosphogluconolactonase [Nocardioides sp. BP30]|uniref:6-phosphogluconolactonase n=1 Tax=Nocardioides sp. BP30 TaxID=3036374 RepID=UPI00246847C6|nr:6-phosphogluconolactonase [Nocardioides sp. BP30]WGL50894.1 6-phosphogluconolactonase [Nocardioides sp. BP30]